MSTYISRYSSWLSIRVIDAQKRYRKEEVENPWNSIITRDKLFIFQATFRWLSARELPLLFIVKVYCRPLSTYLSTIYDDYRYTHRHWKTFIYTYSCNFAESNYKLKGLMQECDSSIFFCSSPPLILLSCISLYHWFIFSPSRFFFSLYICEGWILYTIELKIS